jgi:hypothetical protein
MDRNKKPMSIITLSVFVVLIVALSTFPLWAKFFGFTLFEIRDEEKMIDLENLTRSGNPNDFLMAPSGFGVSIPDEESPVLPINAEKLKQVWFSLMEEQPRTHLLPGEIPDQFLFVQRSWFFQFPDIIAIRFQPQPGERSTLVIYSKSLYGYSDLGVNETRIRTWIGELQKKLNNQYSAN